VRDCNDELAADDALIHDPFYRSNLADIPQESAAWRQRLVQYFSVVKLSQQKIRRTG
jgi:hypothetical protein